MAITAHTTPAGRDDQDQILSAYDCLMRGRTAIYLSGPITTGRVFYEWYGRVGHSLERDSERYRKEFQSSVLRVNEGVILAAAEMLRKKSAIVIEPTSLRMPNWQQADFHRFWCAVISRFCARLVVLDGWEFSVGCAIEFKHAISSSIPVEGLDGRKISPAEGASAIAAAASFVDDLAR